MKRRYFALLGLLVLIPSAYAGAQVLLQLETNSISVTISPSFSIQAVTLQVDSNSPISCTHTSGTLYSCPNSPVTDYAGGTLAIMVTATAIQRVSYPTWHYALSNSSLMSYITTTVQVSTWTCPPSGINPCNTLPYPTQNLSSVAQGEEFAYGVTWTYALNIPVSSFVLTSNLSG